jgi:hypothetical protein
MKSLFSVFSTKYFCNVGSDNRQVTDWKNCNTINRFHIIFSFGCFLQIVSTWNSHFISKNRNFIQIKITVNDIKTVSFDLLPPSINIKVL